MGHEHGRRDSVPVRLARRAAEVSMAALALVGVLPSSTDLTEPIEYRAEDSTVFEGDEIKVAEMNVFGWQNPAGGTNEAGTLNLLRDEQPDVVCMQEWMPNPDLFETIKELGYSYAIAPTSNIPQRGLLGNAVLVRASYMRLVSVTDLPGSFMENMVWQRPRKLMHVRILQEDGTFISVFTFHATNDDNDRAEQFQAIRDKIINLDLTEKESYIVCGDTNATTEEVKKGFGVGELEGGLLLTIPNIFTPTYPDNKRYEDDTPIVPDQDIDHILSYVLNQECRLVNADADTKTVNFGSDHRALIRVIQLENCNRKDNRTASWLKPV